MTRSTDFPGLTRRLASLVYESLLVGTLWLVAAAAFTPVLALGNHAPLLEWLYRLFVAGVFFGYFGYCWVKGGQTLAMKPWRLKVAMPDGRPLSWQQAGIRFAVALVLFVGVPVLSYITWLPALGSPKLAAWAALAWWLLPLLWVFMDNDKQFLHDRLAGTRIFLLAKGERA